MRLTLRTLLAYVDDILDPTHTKEIGAKITESGVASSLMNRIREVMRRRRLTAPDLDGPGSGLDPNIVAEYLDNVLPPDQVADVEKVCLESDVHLAEVAASHQILTAALGESVQVPPEIREHMYALGPVGTSERREPADSVDAPISEGLAATTLAPKNGSGGSGAVAPTADVQTRSERPDPSTPVASTGTDFKGTIPEFLRPRPLWRRALPYAAVVLIIAVWIGLLYYDPPLNPSSGGGNSAQRDGGLDGQLAANQTGGGALSIAGGVSEAAADSTGTSPVDTTKNGGRLTFNQEPIDPAPPADASESSGSLVESKPPSELTLPNRTAPAPGPEAIEKPKTEKPKEGPEVAAVAPNVDPQPTVPNLLLLPAPKVQYNSSKGTLLRFDEEAGDWMVMPPRAIVHSGERFVSPEPFEAVLNIGDSGLHATLVRGTAVRILPPTKMSPIGFGIDQGRVILERPKKAGPDNNDDAADEKPVVISIAVNDERWQLELSEPGTLCGIEITPSAPNQPEQDLGRNSYTGGLYVVSGSVRFSDGAAAPRVIIGSGWQPLTPADRIADGGKDAPLPPPLLTIPQWLDPAAKRRTSTHQRYAALFQKEFYVTRPLSENVPPMIKDPRPYISSLAVKCLALVHDYASLSGALSADHEESRRAAIVGLRAWLPRDKKNGALLKAELGKHFPLDEVDVIYRLLWGFNKQDGMDLVTSTRLVEWLDHHNIAVRELAFFHVKRLTGITYDYHPMRPPLQRSSAINRWQERIKNDGGLITRSKAAN